MSEPEQPRRLEPLVIVRPRRKIGDMTDEERLDFARDVVNVMLQRYSVKMGVDPRTKKNV